MVQEGDRALMAKKKKQKKTRKLKGILSKIGSILIGVAPPAISGVEAVAHATHPSLAGLPIGDKLLIFATRFVNNLTAGLIGKDVIPQIQLKGQTAPHHVGNAWKVGEDQYYPWLVSIGTGIGFKFADWAASKMSGNSADRMAGFTITGKYS